MLKLSLLVLALLPFSASAQSNSAGPNPFARPSAGSASSSKEVPPGAAASGQQPAFVAPGMPGNSAMAPGQTLPPMPPIPGVANSGMLPGGAPGVIPGVAGLPASSDIEQEVSAVRIGTVNGMHLFRGTGTYVFESAKKRKLVTHLVPIMPKEEAKLQTSGSGTGPGMGPGSNPAAAAVAGMGGSGSSGPGNPGYVAPSSSSSSTTTTNSSSTAGRTTSK